MPDRITIFQGPHERMARDPAHLAKLVEDTVWHEVAHYFGMNELQVRAAERSSPAESCQDPPRPTRPSHLPSTHADPSVGVAAP